MQFQVGENIVHTTHGLGVILQIDQKVINGTATHCYVVKIGEMTLWVPFSRVDTGVLRSPTPAAMFAGLFEILRSPGQPLSSDRMERRTHLEEQMKDGRLEMICRVVRDLTMLKRTGKMNDHDKIILERSERFLLNEWEVALSMPPFQAEKMLRELLAENYPPPAPKSSTRAKLG